MSAFLVLGSGANFQVKAFDSPVGEWTYREATMQGHLMRGKITFIDKTRATYTANNGRIHFVPTLDKRKWEGYWIEDRFDACPTARDGSKHWGTMIFQFNADYSQFEGTWNMCGVSEKYTWTGFR